VAAAALRPEAAPSGGVRVDARGDGRGQPRRLHRDAGGKRHPRVDVDNRARLSSAAGCDERLCAGRRVCR